MEFTKNITFKTSAENIYRNWLNSEGHSKMTGGQAICSDKPGMEFTAWDGYIAGKNLILEPYIRIVQSWRTSQFEDHEPDSQIEILLYEENGTTELTLNHTKVPESGDHYIDGWDVHYFEPMTTYFSKGSKKR